MHCSKQQMIPPEVLYAVNLKHTFCPGEPPLMVIVAVLLEPFRKGPGMVEGDIVMQLGGLITTQLTVCLVKLVIRKL